MKNILMFTITLSTVLFITAFKPLVPLNNQASLEKKWSTEASFKTPESVLYNPADKLVYVANINGGPGEKDGNGFISKLGTDGKIIELEWVKGLDGPKGMGIYKNKLYVTDITKLVIIDIASGKIEKSIEVSGSVFLNDIAVDKNGNVYISDSSNKKIYILEGDKVNVWLDSPELQKPNGLFALDTKLRVIDMGSGKFYEIDYKDKKPKQTAENIPSGDGIAEVSKDEYIISNWNGEIYYVKGDKVEKLLDTKTEKLNSADLCYVPGQNLILVPTFFGNSVIAYTLKK